MEKIPLTKVGYDALEAELKNLKAVERPNIIAAISEARAQGDLSENAEYSAAKEKQSFIEGRIQDLEAVLSRAQVIDVKTVHSNVIRFGATVVVADEDTDEEKVARSTAIQEATKYAAQVPLEVARRACALMPRIAEVALKGNQNAVTDACVAMMSARNAVLAAVLNVRINLTSLKDAELVARLQAEADGLEQQACNQEQELLAKIKALLNA